MSFVQIVSFRTDRSAELAAHEEQWLRDTEGRRTLVDGALYVDRSDPRHYYAINYFPSYEEAMVNSALPETTAFAEHAMAVSDGPGEFVDLDLVSGRDRHSDRAAELRVLLETSTDPTSLLDDDVVLDMYVPHGHVVWRGREQNLAGLVDETSARTFDQYDVRTFADGFLVEYAYRTTATADQPSLLSIGTAVCTVTGGRISHLRVHCAGAWTAEQEREIEASLHAGASS